MEEARAVLARLERIETLEREGAPVPTLLGELRALLVEAEAWARAEPRQADLAEEALGRLKDVLHAPPEAGRTQERTLLA